MTFTSCCRWSLALLAACTTAPSMAGDDDGGDDAPAVVASSHFQTFFDVPLVDGTIDHTLENKIIDVIGMMAPHSELHMSMFHFNQQKVADAIIAAYTTNDIHPHIIIDREVNLVDGSLRDAIQSLQKALPADAIVQCTRGKGSCIGDGIDHNKLYAFSELTDGSKNVVVQTSENLVDKPLHNNMVIDRDDPQLYTGYVAYWEQMKKHAPDADPDLDFYTTVDGDHTIAYFFPRETGDTIVSVLDHVKCTSASTLRIAMAFWDDGRIAIANKLGDLEDHGCDVRVLMRHAGPQDSQTVIDTLRKHHIPVGLYPDQHDANIHSKYMAIDSKYDTGGTYEHRQLVFTGSHNYLGSSLRKNDETLLRVDDPDVFAAFMDNWKTIRKQIDDATPDTIQE
ncbi:MAG TPA: phospholipase D-like domain-containing protein [Kofleriaceae bacterium]|jgi:hypothetical protein